MLLKIVLQLSIYLSLCVVSKAVFLIEDEKIGDMNTKVLCNTITGEYVTIIVDYGGRIENLVLRSPSQGKLRQVLLTHNGNATAIKENAWWKGMFLIPWANRIDHGRYKFYNNTYQLPINEHTGGKVNALHGFLANKQMTVEQSTVTLHSALLELQYSFEEEQGFPFRWSLKIFYELKSSGFDIQVYVLNKMVNSPIPLYIGWHPYFACTANQVIITFDNCSAWNHIELNANADPTGITELSKTFDGKSPIGGTPVNPTYFDDEYKSTGMCNGKNITTRLYDPEYDQTVVLWQDYNFRFLHVFTGSTTLFGEGAVAIEPMSGMADAYNNHDHLSILSGSESWLGKFGVYME